MTRRQHALWIVLVTLLQLACQPEAAEEKPSEGSGDKASSRIVRNYSPQIGDAAEDLARRAANLGRNGPVLFPESPPPTDRPLIITSRPSPRPVAVQQRPQPAQAPRANGVADSYSNGFYYEDAQAFAALGALQRASVALRANESRLVERARVNHPYAGVAKKIRKLTGGYGRKGYTSEERQTVLPPIYNALENYAKTKVLTKKSKAKSKPYNGYFNDGIDDEYYNDNSGNEAKHYAFSYAVRDQRTGDDFSHSQRHTGSATNGEYRVKLPDGRLQIVSYTADNGGYKAEVRYEEDPDAINEERPNPVTYQDDNRVPTSPAPPPTLPKAIRPNTLGTIVVPSNEYNDYEVDFYYDDDAPTAAPTPPKEVLITSKPGYLTSTPGYRTSTPSSLVYYQPNALSTPSPYLEGGYYSTTPRYVSSTTTQSPLDEYDQLDQPQVVANRAKVNGGGGSRVKYTTIAPLYRVMPSTTPRNLIEESRRPQQQQQQQQPQQNYHKFLDDPDSIDLRKYFTFRGKR